MRLSVANVPRRRGFLHQYQAAARGLEGKCVTGVLFGLPLLVVGRYGAAGLAAGGVAAPESRRRGEGRLHERRLQIIGMLAQQ
jgi:hypothetical protein